LVRTVDGLDVPFLGREALVQNKRATARLKDLADLEALGESPQPTLPAQPALHRALHGQGRPR